MPGSHALLSASAAHRWISCPPSARLTEDMPDTQSDYAAEGTLAHELGELKLRKKFEKLKKSEYEKRLKAVQENPQYQAEMNGYTDEYLDAVLLAAHKYKSVPYVVIERQVDYSNIAPDGCGTADCLLLHGNDLHVFDFKYGKGVPVSAEKNPQLQLYAIGAINAYSLLYDIRNITLHVVQPRLSNISEYSTMVSEITEWSENVVKPAAQLATEGKGELKAGEHCKFCKAKSTCRKRAELYTSVDDDFKKTPPELLTIADVAEILKRIEGLKDWASDVQDYALDQILAGTEIPGWKAVEGRSNRQIPEYDNAVTVLKAAGIDEAMLYVRKPQTITELEKLVGKKQFTELLGDLIVKPQGAPALAEESDNRPPYSKSQIKNDFGGNNND